VKFSRTLLTISTSLLISTAALAGSDAYRLTNDVSFLDGDIVSLKHIYYPGDTIDIRVLMKGNTALLSDQNVDMYLAIIDAAGNTSYRAVADYQTQAERQVFRITDVSGSVISPGTYQIALIATRPGGNPAVVSDWYNGFAGLIDSDAMTYSETAIDQDFDGDGEWDDDYDRDGFSGDGDVAYQNYQDEQGDHYRGYEGDVDWHSHDHDAENQQDRDSTRDSDSDKKGETGTDTDSDH